MGSAGLPIVYRIQVACRLDPSSGCVGALIGVERETRIISLRVRHLVSGDRCVDKAKWIGVGISLGLVFGLVIHEIGIGIIFGVALGAGIAAIMARREGA